MVCTILSIIIFQAPTEQLPELSTVNACLAQSSKVCPQSSPKQHVVSVTATPTILVPTCLFRAMMKDHGPKARWEEGVYLAYTSTSLFIKGRSQDRNSSQAGTWKQETILDTSFLIMTCLACFLTEPRTTMSWTLLPSISN